MHCLNFPMQTFEVNALLITLKCCEDDIYRRIQQFRQVH